MSGTSTEDVKWEKESIREVAESPNIPISGGDGHRDGLFQRIVDSFKRVEGEVRNSSDLEDGEVTSAHSTKLKQNMKTRHVVLMSLGTGIGTGLLVANASSLHFGGPGGLLIGYFFVSIISYIMMQAAGEMAVAYPTLPGNFNAYSSIFISKPFGFATVWLFCIQWTTILPLELITSSIVVKYWTTKINADIFVLIFYLFILCIHFCGARGYGETEFIFNSCKVLMVAGFIIVGILINCGAVGDDGYIGGKYWHEPGAFAAGSGIDRFKGIAYVLVTAYFSYGGMELYALSVNELPNPRKAIPSACAKGVYRILIIYMLTMVIIGFLVPHDSNKLLGSGSSGVHPSPYVLALSLHGIKIVPHIINAVILISVISVGNSAMYSGPRLLCSLAQQGYAPKILDYVDRQGRPLMALIICSVFGLIAFVAASKYEEDIFGWLAAISGLSELFTWTAICLSHFRFRRAMKLQGRSLETLGYRSTTGEWGSLYAVVFNVFVLIAQLWVAMIPMDNGGKFSVKSLFKSCLALPLWLSMAVGYMIVTKNWTILNPLSSISVDSHRRSYDVEVMKQEDLEYKQKMKRSKWYVRMSYTWC
ncbi:amino acid permease Ecym_2662 [Eremothecium cymbalariae DBVPG|uniref:Amino acid permease/ SLC12A domain-containing protein n=1 Tax=Eremothecium cymbalariae (strain CBS 270.75 / DBVPG 7215 / KCTC 17166 / NRRL Y-17582) TaxID=931890 RepID=G8JNU7_ERECY|nr:Hypothetical protein Ecym_2662 [Eremothecium cymbalariae DBVPG\